MRDRREFLDNVRFQLLVESVKDYAIFMLDTGGHIQSWNPGAQRIKQYTATEIIGKHFSIFYEEHEKYTKPKHELEVAAATGKYEEEGWRLRKDGTRFWANVVISAVRDHDGTLVGFSKVTRDLTERRAAEEALKRSNRELDEYASFVSHDLQEPLRKMASFAELLRARYNDKLDDAGREYIRIIVDGASRMRSLIVDVLEYSRLGRSAPLMTEISLDEVVGLAVRDLEVSIRDAGGTVRFGSLPRMRGNAALLARLFLNLISNGLKYRRPGAAPVVAVSSDRRNGELVVTVRDNGIGFDASHSERIMRPFQRLYSKEKYPGTGLGLAVAKKIAEMHGARMWAESKPGEGAAFHVAFPA